ncbi:hypothetical protein LOD99_12207 [Oopsacas minuta]|uniref:EGF-like domain-containing protein n=1 Tax=Oopsacas minuta TaxID=111878 RepID=A0AAV7JFG7_9METZ|nr:hypothetical protein LOD99_12207 [Oopsacas minuta]
MHVSIIICLIISLLIPLSTTQTPSCGVECICEFTYITCNGATVTEIPSEVLGAILSDLDQFICSTCAISILTADSFILYTSLNTITILNSGLNEIEAGAFSGISSQLNYLDLSSNSITTIEQHFFTGLTKLGHLDLQQNSITHIEPGSFNDLTSLSTVTLKNNLITNLPDFLFTSTILTQFDITNNELFALTSRPFPNTVYTIFYLSNNNIARLHSNLSSIFNTASRILLNSNPLICDCFIKDLQSEISVNPSRYGESTMPAKCGYPPSLVNQKVSEANIPSGGCYSACLNIQCHTSATCIDVDDWPVCVCNAGYAGDGYNCVDACDGFGCQGVSVCNYDTVTMNTSCVCPTGYTLDMTGKDCTQINECLIEGSCPVNSNCSDTVGSYLCDCFDGYEVNTGPLSCDDINECSLVNNCITNTTCLNTIGSYQCDCIPGYVENSTGFCVDIDECSNSTICHINSYCNNTIGAYICKCNPGYEGDGLECMDIDECQNAALFNCPPNSACQNEMGNYTCVCDPGYEKIVMECVDINECDNMLLFDCPTNSMCQNTLGNYTCDCDPGYEKIVMECVDINECDNMLL